MKSLNLPVPQIDLCYWCGSKGPTRRDRQMAGKIFRARAKAYVHRHVRHAMSEDGATASATMSSSAHLKLVQNSRKALDHFESTTELHYALADLAETDGHVICDKHGHVVAWTQRDRLAA